MHTHFQECLDNQSVLIHTCMMSMMTVRVLSWVGPRNFRTRFIRVMLLHSMKSSSPSWLLRTSSSFNNSATCGEFNVLLRNLELKKQNWVNYKQQLDPRFFLLQKFQGIKLWTVLSVKGKTRFSKKKGSYILPAILHHSLNVCSQLHCNTFMMSSPNLERSFLLNLE